MTCARRAIACARRARSGAIAVTALLGAALFAPPASSWAQGATGGTEGPNATIQLDVSGAGGAQAPVGQGTGGSEYGFAPIAPHRAPSHHGSPSHRGSSPRTTRGARRFANHGASHPHSPVTKRTPRPLSRLAPKSAPKPTPKKPAPRPTSKKPTSKPTPKPSSPASPPSAQTPPGVPPPAQTVADGAVFPVRGGPHSFGGPEARFGAPRGGHTHQGQDILAAEGLSDVAPLAGSIIATGNQPGGAGWYVAEHTSVGFDLFFAHCESESVQVSAGQAVGPGTVLCKLGSTGDASGPHLHFEMWVGGWHAKGGHPIDPLPYLEAWEGH
jgi:murein DD-endopeptidase MepM/ murein hydrolase activator NlpD